MNLILIWFLGYVLPAGISGGIAFFFPRKATTPRRDILIIHVALLFSIVVIQYAIHASGFVFPWYINSFSLTVFAAGALCAFFLIGTFGLWYALSAFIQELAMLSVAFLLLPAFSVPIVILFVGGVFVPCHFLTLERWRLKLFLVSLWSITSILLFVLTGNVWLIAAIHTVLGAFLISKSILFAGLQPGYLPIQNLIRKDAYQVFLMYCPATLPFSFAVHTWFIVNRKGEIGRYGISHYKAPIPKIFAMHDCAAGCQGHFHTGIRSVEVIPGIKFLAWPERVFEYREGLEGSLADRMGDFIAHSITTYPYAARYSLLGPNSNTFPAWVLSHFPESGLRMPWNAVGKNYFRKFRA